MNQQQLTGDRLVLYSPSISLRLVMVLCSGFQNGNFSLGNSIGYG